MSLFTPNGLLGSSSLDKPTEPVPEAPPLFTLNGYLGPLSASALGSSKPAEPPSFTLNGHLGPLSASSGSSKPLESPAAPSFTLDGPSSSLAGPSKQFTPNGLLSDPQTDVRPTFTFTPNGLLGSQDDDDDDLPTVAEAFGIPTTLPARAESAQTTPEYAPRFSVRATTFDGKTMYLKRKPKVSHLNRTKAPLGNFKERMGNLLDVPIHRLMEGLSVDTANKLQEADRQAAASASAPEESPEDTLWVDRYRPRQFTDLMGNERVARETMEWVKQWDWCVFGKTKGKKRPRDDDEAFDAADEYHRPREKLLLLSGPPGLGKTTLAHVVARQAGYEVMEINASDARSGSVIDDRIRPALESGCAVGSTKPVLLIIDEIDGATGAGENACLPMPYMNHELR